ncbi:MAG: hypothetical protein HY017_14090 [Betaproteobacteria bacterium]|nr:hypothetical protein [Betaproteobacteria bacterium]
MSMVSFLPWCRIEKAYDVGEVKILPYGRHKPIDGIVWSARRPLVSSRASLSCVDERRVANDRPDCFWLYLVPDRNNAPRFQEPIHYPARLDWNAVTRGEHYYRSVNAMRRQMRVWRDEPSYAGKRP